MDEIRTISPRGGEPPEWGWISRSVAAIVLSGISISVEETLGKAVAAEILPRELRSLGFGILACANAVGDMASSLYVGLLLQHGEQRWAFGLASGLGVAGVVWMVGVLSRRRTGGEQILE